MGNYKITHVRSSVRPSGVISQRWLDRCFWNHNMLFPSTPGWCPSLRNFKIIKNGRLTAILRKSCIEYIRNHWQVIVHKKSLAIYSDDSQVIASEGYRHCSILFMLLNSQHYSLKWFRFLLIFGCFIRLLIIYVYRIDTMRV